jgi:hypothetical protein
VSLEEGWRRIAAYDELVAALERIANHSADLTGAPDMQRIARAALTKAGA